MHGLHGEAGPEGSADTDAHSTARSCQERGEVPGLPDAEFDVIAATWGGSDREGGLTYPRDFKHDKLAWPEGKIFSFLMIDDPDTVEAFHFCEPCYAGDLGLVRVFKFAEVLLPEVPPVALPQDVYEF